MVHACDELSDTKLAQALLACASGDKAAFRTIYDETSGKCYSIVLGIVRDREQAKDILQRAYVSIWKKAHTYDPAKGKAFTWILVIMRNRAVDYLRAKSRSAETEIIPETLVDDTQRTPAQAEAWMLNRTLGEHLRKLPKQMATAIHLNIVEGWTCSEISAHMDVSRNTVKSWIRRGLSKLRHDLPFESYQAAI